MHDAPTPATGRQHEPRVSTRTWCLVSVLVPRVSTGVMRCRLLSLRLSVRWLTGVCAGACAVCCVYVWKMVRVLVPELMQGRAGGRACMHTLAPYPVRWHRHWSPATRTHADAVLPGAGPVTRTHADTVLLHPPTILSGRTRDRRGLLAVLVLFEWVPSTHIPANDLKRVHSSCRITA